MNNDQNWTVREGVFAAAAIAFVLFLHGAVPFFMTPTLGHAVWTTGFSQSFANGPLYSIYAHEFGIPKPAAIAFGLAGAWPASLLIRLGLHPADAYSGMVALWLVMSFFSAYKIARKFGTTRPAALLGGAAWMSMPVIWAHAGYGMLSLGIGLLPFYFLTALNFFLVETSVNKVTVSTIVFYFLAAIIAVFMDGYTFMMFATGASILFAFTVISRPELRTTLLRIALPVHVASFALAYVLFSIYIGKSNFDAHPIDFFRGWGLDLSFIAIPTRGIHWLPDLLGMSLQRSDETFFGDGSVWETTFSLPIVLAGLAAWWLSRKKAKIATGALLVAAFGFYMALGPSLKINSTKPESLQLSHPGQQSALMPADLAVMPTGNAWISEKLPGFNVMRASYRWSALGVFALWLLVMIWVARTDKKGRVTMVIILLGLIVINLPNIPKRLQDSLDARTMFQQIDRDLVSELQKQISKGETVALLPWGNDFIANYLAPRTGFGTFNIGGDKNLLEAQTQWPSEMLALGGEIDSGKVSIAMKMLFDGTADVLVIPYFSMLWSAVLWRGIDETTAQRKADLRPLFKDLESYVEVVDTDLFATIRLRPEFEGSAKRAALASALLSNVHYPITLGSGLKDSAFILSKGWHALEEHHVWSQADSKLTLPIPKDCVARHCVAVLKFGVFGASPQRPVTVSFDSADPGGRWSEKIISTSGHGNEVAVPLRGASGSREISISIPDATSPQALTGSADGRILGIALQRIELVFK